MKYNYNIDEEIVLIQKYNLSPNALFVLKSILLLQDGEDKYLSSLVKANVCDLRSVLTELQDKSIILTSWKIPEKGQEFDPNSIPINKTVVKTIWRASFELGKELFDEYPQFGVINGATIPLRTVARKFDSLEDAFRVYAKNIKHNPETHSKIIELVKWAKENNILQMSLASFIINQSYYDLEALKDGDSGINYNAVKLI